MVAAGGLVGEERDVHHDIAALAGDRGGAAVEARGGEGEDEGAGGVLHLDLEGEGGAGLDDIVHGGVGEVGFERAGDDEVAELEAGGDIAGELVGGLEARWRA